MLVEQTSVFHVTLNVLSDQDLRRGAPCASHRAIVSLSRGPCCFALVGQFFRQCPCGMAQLALATLSVFDT